MGGIESKAMEVYAQSGQFHTIVEICGGPLSLSSPFEMKEEFCDSLISLRCCGGI